MTPFPCPYVYPNGQRCPGQIVRIEALNAYATADVEVRGGQCQVLSLAQDVFPRPSAEVGVGDSQRSHGAIQTDSSRGSA